MVILNDARTQNLLSYKYYIRPTSHQLYGNSNPTLKHHQNVQTVLKMLALEGTMTTWDMAKHYFANNPQQIRSREKEFRRLLIGRTDRGRHSKGILDLNLVLVNDISTKRNPGNKYRLSLFGILFCLDVLDLSHNQIDKMAKNYNAILPLVFGKWDFLKSIVGENVYNISLLGKGLLFDNLHVVAINNPQFYELISYFNIKSNQLSQSLNEEKIGELISLWFYITMLYFPTLVSINQKPLFYLKKILKKDKKLQQWFSNYVDEAKKYYLERNKILEKLSIV